MSFHSSKNTWNRFFFFNRSTLIGRDFLTLRDFNETEVKDLLSTAADLKKKVLEENKV